MNLKNARKARFKCHCSGREGKGQTAALWICMQVTNLHNAHYITAHNDEQTEVCLNFIGNVFKIDSKHSFKIPEIKFYAADAKS